MTITRQNIGRRRIAVIGSGISGLSAAWLLKADNDVVMYEAAARFGGHSNTALIPENGREIPVDTGFMVFNRPNYPLLSQLFDTLGIETYDTDMSFSVSLDEGGLEYAGSNLNTLFAQRSNLVKPSFLGMLADILRFNRAIRQLLLGQTRFSENLGQFLDRHKLGVRFREDYLYPMAAAIWSCPRDAVAHFPALSFARFFSNHGLIDIRNRPQWQTLRGGASTYVNRLVQDLGERAQCGRSVKAVQRHQHGVCVVLDGNEKTWFDEVIFACHSDQALRLLENAAPTEVSMLSSVPYQANRVLLHSDASLMPRRDSVWSSWNYMGGRKFNGERAVSVSYWMNSLQQLDTDTNYFVTLNPLAEPDPAKVVSEYEYHHPVFGSDSLRLPQQLSNVQGRDRIWFCGAWTGYGFHEDGMRSGVDVAVRLGARLPWEVHKLQVSSGLFDGNLSGVEQAA